MPAENDADVPDFPWTIEADLLANSGHAFDSNLTDLVIARYLMSGDVRPLGWFLLRGHVPSGNLLRYIGAMIAQDPATVEKVPFSLVAKARKGKRGRPKKGPEQQLRDMLIFLQVEALIEASREGSYDGAIEEIAAFQGLTRPVVKRAYDDLRKKLDQAKRPD